jgi:alpha-aminoadipate/glutamate carrier protein LysW
METEINCTDCDDIIKIPEGTIQGEILSCVTCGSDFELKEGKLVPAERISEDWGE